MLSILSMLTYYNETRGFSPPPKTQIYFYTKTFREESKSSIFILT